MREKPTVSEAQVPDQLLEIQRRFAWEEQAEAFAIERSWSSRTATLFLGRARPGGEPTVVLKVLADADAEQAKALHEALRGLQDAFPPNGPTRVRAPQALGWLRSPASLCIRYIDGADVMRMFADLNHPCWSATGWDHEDLANECGRALGIYHSFPHPSIAPDDGDLERAARAMHIGPRLLAQLSEHTTPVPSFGDFGPHQFMLGRDGTPFLLDPPERPTSAPAHGDLARFLFGLRKALARDPKADRARRLRLRTAFLQGYAATGTMDPLSPEGRRLVRLYEGAMARGVARQRWAIGRRREALRWGRRWMSAAASVRR